MIVFMGVAGAGKSVQGKLLAEKMDCEWVSTGELLRTNLSGKRQQGMLEGKLLADDEIIQVVKEFFKSTEESSRCILDGFPRTLVQAEWLLEQYEQKKLDISAIVHLEASKDIVKARLLKRGRPDDNEQAIEMRFLEYEKHTLPIIDRFRQINLPVYSVKAEGSISEIHDEIWGRVSQNAG